MSDTTMDQAAPSVSSTVSGGRYELLDGLRGLAAFAVILDHIYSYMLGSMFPGRYLAVDFFFVLSGFVLAHAHGDRLQAGGATRWFMSQRLVRLYPFYLLGFLLGTGTALLRVFAGWSHTPSSEFAVVAAFGLVFLPAPVFSWTGNQLYPFNGPSWSLFFELVANLVFALVAPRLTWRVFAVCLPVLAVLTGVTVVTNADLGPGWLWPHWQAGLARILYGFFAGVLLYRLRAVAGAPAYPAWLAVLGFLAIIGAPIQEEWRRAFDALTAILFAPAIVWLGAGARLKGWAGRLAVFLGSLSYGVYVTHVPLWNLIQTGLDFIGADSSPRTIMVLVVALSAGTLAAIAGRLWDKPVRRWMTARLKL